MRGIYFLFVNIVVYLLFTIAILQGYGVSEYSSSSPKVAGASTEINPIRSDLVDKINTIRNKHAVERLSVNKDLMDISIYRAKDMVNNDYYSHIQPDGTDYYSLFKTRKSFSCENLNITSVNDINHIIEEWLNSDKGHKECLLDVRAKDVGIYQIQLPTDDDNNYLTVLIISS